MINKLRVTPIPLCRPKKSDKWFAHERLSHRTIIVDHISKEVVLIQKLTEKKRERKEKKAGKTVKNKCWVWLTNYDLAILQTLFCLHCVLESKETLWTNWFSPENVKTPIKR